LTIITNNNSRDNKKNPIPLTAQTTTTISTIKNNNNYTIYSFFRIATFHKRADSSYICLMLDTRGLAESYKGPGYHLPHVKIDMPTGIHSYPAIFSYPTVSRCDDNENILITGSWLDGMENSGIFKTMKRQWSILITGSWLDGMENSRIFKTMKRQWSILITGSWLDGMKWDFQINEKTMKHSDHSIMTGWHGDFQINEKAGWYYFYAKCYTQNPFQ
jgi:hypothetical protein